MMHSRNLAPLHNTNRASLNKATSRRRHLSEPIPLQAGLVRCDQISMDEAWGKFGFRGTASIQGQTEPTRSQPPQHTSLSATEKRKSLPTLLPERGPPIRADSTSSRVPDGYGGFVLQHPSSSAPPVAVSNGTFQPHASRGQWRSDLGSFLSVDKSNFQAQEGDGWKVVERKRRGRVPTQVQSRIVLTPEKPRLSVCNPDDPHARPLIDAAHERCGSVISATSYTTGSLLSSGTSDLSVAKSFADVSMHPGMILCPVGPRRGSFLDDEFSASSVCSSSLSIQHSTARRATAPGPSPYEWLDVGHRRANSDPAVRALSQPFNALHVRSSAPIAAQIRIGSAASKTFPFSPRLALTRLSSSIARHMHLRSASLPTEHASRSLKMQLGHATSAKDTAYSACTLSREASPPQSPVRMSYAQIARAELRKDLTSSRPGLPQPSPPRPARRPMGPPPSRQAVVSVSARAEASAPVSRPRPPLLASQLSLQAAEERKWAMELAEKMQRLAYEERQSTELRERDRAARERRAREERNLRDQREKEVRARKEKENKRRAHEEQVRKRREEEDRKRASKVLVRAQVLAQRSTARKAALDIRSKVAIIRGNGPRSVVSAKFARVTPPSLPIIQRDIPSRVSCVAHPQNYRTPSPSLLEGEAPQAAPTHLRTDDEAGELWRILEKQLGAKLSDGGETLLPSSSEAAVRPMASRIPILSSRRHGTAALCCATGTSKSSPRTSPARGIGQSRIPTSAAYRSTFLCDAASEPDTSSMYSASDSDIEETPSLVSESGSSAAGDDDDDAKEGATTPTRSLLATNVKVGAETSPLTTLAISILRTDSVRRAAETDFADEGVWFSGIIGRRGYIGCASRARTASWKR